MSRIGRKPVPVPPTVKVSIADSTIEVEGPKGKLSFTHRPEIDVKLRPGRPARSSSPGSDDERINRSLHGLTRSLVANMVQGVTTGYTKKLEIVGVGYQAQLKKANTVALQVGYANQVVLEAPPGVTVTVPDADPHHHQRRRQAGRRPVRRHRPQGPPARALQGQGNPLRGRGRPPQGRQGLRVEVTIDRNRNRLAAAIDQAQRCRLSKPLRIVP